MFPWKSQIFVQKENKLLNEKSSEIEMILLNSVYIKYTLENLGSNKRRSDIA